MSEGVKFDKMTMPTGPASDVPTATYNASCHCGAFSYTVTAAPPLDDHSGTVMQCNCSICTRNGYLLIYVPDERVVFTKGSMGEFSSYSFNTKKMGHLFCGTCGSSCMVKSKDPDFFPGLTAINVRMIHDVDLNALNYKLGDGKNL